MTLSLLKPFDMSPLIAMLTADAPPGVVADWLIEQEVEPADVCLLFARDYTSTESLKGTPYMQFLDLQLLPCDFPVSVFAGWAGQRFAHDVHREVVATRLCPHVLSIDFPMGLRDWKRRMLALLPVTREIECRFDERMIAAARRDGFSRRLLAHGINFQQPLGDAMSRHDPKDRCYVVRQTVPASAFVPPESDVYRESRLRKQVRLLAK